MVNSDNLIIIAQLVTQWAYYKPTAPQNATASEKFLGMNIVKFGIKMKRTELLDYVYDFFSRLFNYVFTTQDAKISGC